MLPSLWCCNTTPVSCITVLTHQYKNWLIFVIFMHGIFTELFNWEIFYMFSIEKLHFHRNLLHHHVMTCYRPKWGRMVYLWWQIHPNPRIQDTHYTDNSGLIALRVIYNFLCSYLDICICSHSQWNFSPDNDKQNTFLQIVIKVLISERQQQGLRCPIEKINDWN